MLTKSSSDSRKIITVVDVYLHAGFFAIRDRVRLSCRWGPVPPSVDNAAHVRGELQAGHAAELLGPSSDLL